MNKQNYQSIPDILGSVPRQIPFAALRASLVSLLALTLLTGLIYPLLVTGISQLAFPYQANGSLVRDGQGQVRASRLLAQNFPYPQFFQARPSAVNWAATASGASNLAITSQAQVDAIKARKADWAKRFGSAPAPVEMLYASGSGLDPDISLESALAQINIVVAARHLDSGAVIKLKSLVESLTRQALPGEPARINVVELNQSLLLDPAFNPGM